MHIKNVVEENVEKAQKIFSHRAKMCFLAAKGEWTETLEN